MSYRVYRIIETGLYIQCVWLEAIQDMHMVGYNYLFIIFFGLYFYITQPYKVNALAAWFQHPQFRPVLLHLQIHTFYG